MVRDFDFSHKDNIPSKYYEGVLVDKWKTPNGNLMIQLKQIKEIHIYNNKPVFVDVEYESMNFLVPKRRMDVVSKCELLDLGKVLQVKLLQEQRSLRFTVSRISY